MTAERSLCSVTPQVRALGEVGLEATLGCASLMAGSTQTYPYPAQTRRTTHGNNRSASQPSTTPSRSSNANTAPQRLTPKTQFIVEEPVQERLAERETTEVLDD